MPLGSIVCALYRCCSSFDTLFPLLYRRDCLEFGVVCLRNSTWLSAKLWEALFVSTSTRFPDIHFWLCRRGGAWKCAYPRGIRCLGTRNQDSSSRVLDGVKIRVRDADGRQTRE